MEPIKSNQLLNQYPPLDLAEIKSQPLKLPKNNCCSSSSWQFLVVFSTSTMIPNPLSPLSFYPPISRLNCFPTSPHRGWYLQFIRVTKLDGYPLPIYNTC
ncbi:hypothetical protein Hanom_Chr09g00850741 [Helianthus anomalus]